MRKTVTSIALMFAGALLGLTFEHTASIRSAYDRGLAAGRGQIQREAVREGHAYWKRPANGQGLNQLEWLPARQHYNADRSEDLPIDAALSS